MPRLPLFFCTTALLLAAWAPVRAQPDGEAGRSTATATATATAMEPAGQPVSRAASEQETAAPSELQPGQEGRVAYYARKFAGRKTANGERHSPAAFTMAHPTLPMGTVVRVTNLATQHSVVVRVNDRGPYVGARVADVSEAAAKALRMLRAGVIHARLDVLHQPGR